MRKQDETGQIVLHSLGGSFGQSPYKQSWNGNQIMHEVMDELVSQLDLLESQGTSSFSWKPSFDQIMGEMDAVNAKARQQLDQSGNPLFGLLARQNEILMSLAVIGIITGHKK